MNGVTKRAFDVNAWIEKEWTRERYDFLNENTPLLSAAETPEWKSRIEEWKWIPQKLSQVDDSNVKLDAKGFPGCPSGYIAPDYGSYYPVCGAKNLGIAVQLTDLKGTLKLPEIVNTTGYAMKRNDDAGALVLAGGTSNRNGCGSLTLFGKDHASMPSCVSVGSYGHKNLVVSPEHLTYGGKEVMTTD